MTAKLNTKGFTRIELIIVIAFLVLLSLIGAPMLLKTRSTASQVACTGRLEGHGRSLQSFANDHGGQHPMSTSTNKGGTREYLMNGNLADHFRAIKDYVQLELLICPLDVRRGASDWNLLSVSNLSYFVALDGRPKAGSDIVMGDRHIASGKSGFVNFPENIELRWVETESNHKNWGNILHADGFVRSYDENHLKDLFSTSNTFLQLVIP